MQSVAFPPSDCHKCQGSHKIHIILKLLHIIIYLSVEKEQQIIGGGTKTCTVFTKLLQVSHGSYTLFYIMEIHYKQSLFPNAQ